MCRRVGAPLCGRPNCPALFRPYGPGQHGARAARRRRISDYEVRLMEKQKLRAIYGVTESQMRRGLQRVKSEPSPGAALVRDLERRVDSVVYRLGLAASLLEARALVAHGHVRVNGRKVDIASQALRPGDVISLDEAGRRLAARRRSEGDAVESPPPYLELDEASLTGRLVRLPERDEVPLPVPVDDRLVVEFYA
jgi:small subunit ribosomal protein S4